MGQELAWEMQKMEQEARLIGDKTQEMINELDQVWRGRDANEFKYGLSSLQDTVIYIADTLQSLSQNMA